MRKSFHFYPSELALFGYLVFTGLLIVIHHSFLPHAHTQLAFRIAVILVIGLLAWIQHKNSSLFIVKLIRFVLPLVLLTYLYTETDALNNFFFTQDLDPFFSGLEESLFGFQPALAFAERLPSQMFAEAMYFGYFSYYLLLVIVPLYIFFKGDQAAADRAMFIVIHSFFIFYLIFIIFPVGGPQFYFPEWPELPQGYFFGSLMRLIQENGEAPTAAFPSSHISMCLMLILLCFRYAKELLKFVMPVALLLILSTVYIRAHYAIDIVAAIIVTPAIYLFSNFIFNRIYSNSPSSLLHERHY